MIVEGTVDASDLTDFLKRLDAEIETILMESIVEAGEDMAKEMQAADWRNLAHDSFTVHKRKGAVAIGPSKAGGRAHVVRFWEFGTIHLPAEGLIRKVADKSDATVKKKLTKRFKETLKVLGK